VEDNDSQVVILQQQLAERFIELFGDAVGIAKKSSRSG